jgi:hypothetical protein
MNLLPRCALLAVLLPTAACYAYRLTSSFTPEPGSRVRIVFTSSIVITTWQPGPDSTRRTHPGVLEASGTIQAAAGDTIALRLGELRTAAGVVSSDSNQVAMLPTAQIARIEERRFQAGTTALAGAGALALAASAFIVVIIAAITRGF